MSLVCTSLPGSGGKVDGFGSDPVAYDFETADQTPLDRLLVTCVEVLTAQFTMGRPVAQQGVDERHYGVGDRDAAHQVGHGSICRADIT